jgi:magnesium transporter
MSDSAEHLSKPILTVARKDFVTLRSELTVRASLETIRERGIGEKIVYFYIVDADETLVGVLPTRRLLTAALTERLSDLMIPRVVTISHRATVMEACEAFVLYKFLAFPVVDDRRRIVGVVDVNLLSEQVFDLVEREQTDALFESIGFQVSQVRDASPARAFRLRFPWLMATITSGMLCALLTSVFELTLAKSIVLAFFMTLVLGLGESVSIQSMTVTIQALRATRPTWGWYVRAFRKEIGTAAMLGTACGSIVGAIVWLWLDAGMTAIAVGGSVVFALCAACLLGLSVPAALHALRLDPKIAAGPVTLALADICTLGLYFGIATLLLA